MSLKPLVFLILNEHPHRRVPVQARAASLQERLPRGHDAAEQELSRKSARPGGAHRPALPLRRPALGGATASPGIGSAPPQLGGERAAPPRLGPRPQDPRDWHSLHWERPAGACCAHGASDFFGTSSKLRTTTGRSSNCYRSQIVDVSICENTCWFSHVFQHLFSKNVSMCRYCCTIVDENMYCSVFRIIVCRVHTFMIHP